MARAKYLVNGAVLAQIFGIAQGTLPHWRRAGMPIERTGARGVEWQYDTIAVSRWLIERQSGGGEESLDLSQERARLAHHQANKTALEEGLLRGEIIRTTDVVQTWQQQIGAARAKLLLIPGKMATMVNSGQSFEETKGEAERLVREALGELEGTGLPASLERALGDSLPGLEATATAEPEGTRG